MVLDFDEFLFYTIYTIKFKLHTHNKENRFMLSNNSCYIVY